MPEDNKAAAKVEPLRKAHPCPECGKPSHREHYPFCSNRCREVDLSRWLTGAYGIQGLAGSFVQKMVGSYTNVVGLPLYETILLLAGEGFDVHSRWPEG